MLDLLSRPPHKVPQDIKLGIYTLERHEMASLEDEILFFHPSNFIPSWPLCLPPDLPDRLQGTCCGERARDPPCHTCTVALKRLMEFLQHPTHLGSRVRGGEEGCLV